MIQGIIKILKDSTSVVEDVGVNAKGNKPKIYPVVCPQEEDTTYLICVRRAQTPTQGRCVSTLDFAKIELKACADDYETADRITNNARLAIDGFRGSSAGVEIDSVKFTNIQDGFDPEASADGKYVISSFYDVTVRREIVG